jgi:hypothetical protein
MKCDEKTYIMLYVKKYPKYQDIPMKSMDYQNNLHLLLETLIICEKSN